MEMEKDFYVLSILIASWIGFTIGSLVTWWAFRERPPYLVKSKPFSNESTRNENSSPM